MSLALAVLPFQEATVGTVPIVTRRDTLWSSLMTIGVRTKPELPSGLIKLPCPSVFLLFQC